MDLDNASDQLVALEDAAAVVQQLGKEQHSVRQSPHHR